MKESLTPEQLGEMLTAGEITKEEAIEIMAQRTRQEALKSLYGPAMENPKDGLDEGKGADGRQARAGTDECGAAENTGGSCAVCTPCVWIWLALAVAGLLGLLLYLAR